MAQLLVRNVSEQVVQALKAQAREHGRSVEAEHRAILERTLNSADHPFWDQAAKLREDLRVAYGDLPGNSADLIRQDRDSR